jgi:hypothetical protein
VWWPTPLYPGRRRAAWPLHRLILGLVPGDGLEVDHINGDPLDNRRANLRAVTRAQNCQNVVSFAGSTSPYRGVSWSVGRGMWLARGYTNGRQHFLGYFTSELQAASVVSAWREAHMPYTNEARSVRAAP